MFGLDLYGVDVLLGPDGPVVVDINDFPSFRQVPDAVARVSRAVLRLARTGTAVSVPAPALVREPSSVVSAVSVPSAPEPLRLPAQGAGVGVGGSVGAVGVGGAGLADGGFGGAGFVSGGMGGAI